MKSEKRISALIAMILSLAIALGGLGCILTGFDLEPDDLVHLIWMVVFIAAITTLCLSLRLGELLLTVLVLLAISHGLRHGDLLLSLEKVLNHITHYYDTAYGWGYIRWSTENLRRADPDSALLLMAALSTMATVWVVLRKQWFGFAVLAGLLPLIACSIVTDTLPADSWLWLLLTALLLLTMTQFLRHTDVRDANRLTALLLVPVMLFSTFLFRHTSQDLFLGPAISIQQELMHFLSQQGLPDGTGPGTPGIDRPGISGSADLSALDGLNHSGATVMSVTSSQWDGVLYLRGQAFDRYTGKSWDATVNDSGERGWPNRGLVRFGWVTVKTDTALPLLYFPYYINTGDWEDGIRDGYLPNSEGQTEYDFALSRPSYRYQASGLQQREIEQFTALPKETLAAARKILSQIGVQSDTPPAEIATIISGYVSRSAAYDKSTGAMPADAEDFALWFLEEGDTGYCVHFATATAVLMRAAGVPARYVTGYMTRVTAEAECAVLDSQAHAWVEYYQPTRGWTVLDATPAEVEPPIIITPPPTEPPETTAPPETTQPTETTRPTETTAPTVPSETTRPAPSTEPSEATDPPEITVPGASATAPTEPTAPQISFWAQLNLKWIRGLLWIAAIWLLIAGQYQLRLKLRKRRMRTGTPSQQAICRWRHVRRIARVSGLPAGELLPLAEKAAFSQHELTAEELAQFDAWFPKANRKLLEKPWVIQFVLRLIFAVE